MCYFARTVCVWKLKRVARFMLKRAEIYTRAVWGRLSAPPAMKVSVSKNFSAHAFTSKFPWVQRYRHTSGLTNLYDAFRLKNTFEYLWFLVDSCILMDSMGGKLVATSVSAFTKATHFIFEQNRPNDAGQDKIKSGLLDKKLKYFYANAVQKHLLSEQNNCTYTLHKIDKGRVCDMKLLINAQRGAELPDHDFVTRSYGLFCFLDDSKINSANPLKLRQHIDDLLGNYAVCTVRVKINLDCTGITYDCMYMALIVRANLSTISFSETFAITSTATGAVLQGSLQPRKVTHQVIYRAMLSFAQANKHPFLKKYTRWYWRTASTEVRAR